MCPLIKDLFRDHKIDYSFTVGWSNIVCVKYTFFQFSNDDNLKSYLKLLILFLDYKYYLLYLKKVFDIKRIKKVLVIGNIIALSVFCRHFYFLIHLELFLQFRNIPDLLISKLV